MRQANQLMRAAAVAATAIVFCAMAAVGLAELVLAITPIALLLLALLGGCYPGEGALAWMATRFGSRGAPPPSGATRVTVPAAARVMCANGGLLIALRLCGRAPPALAR
ncbi:MAG: hypothetical protein ACR2LK_08445 [Solirubrobacteraceae bacterium]